MKKKVMIVVGLLMLSFIIGSQKSEAIGTRQDIVNEAHKYLGVRIRIRWHNTEWI